MYDMKTETPAAILLCVQNNLAISRHIFVYDVRSVIVRWTSQSVHFAHKVTRKKRAIFVKASVQYVT